MVSLSYPNTYARTDCLPSFTEDVFRYFDGKLVKVPTVNNIPITYLDGDAYRSGSETIAQPYMHVPSEDDWVSDQLFYSILNSQRRVPPLSDNFSFIQQHGASAWF
jgi:hypothetical protein